MTDHFHTIVIGAGSGGLTVAYGLAALGRRVALIEAHHVGGDCTNVGCIPSKTLIHVAQQCDGNAAAALARVRQKRDALREKETHEFGAVANLSLIFGRARIVAPHQAAVALPEGGERILTARHIVIATGARPRLLSVPGLPAERTLTNESIFEIDHAPKHLVIIGGGAIGVELAFAFRNLGSRVSIIDAAPRVLTQYLPEASRTIEESLRARGVALHLNASVHSYDEAAHTLRVEQGGQIASLEEVDAVLVAVGRERNVEGLGLEKVGVCVTPHDGIVTDAYGRTSVPGIYAVGEVTATSAFSHSASAQGRRVVQQIAFPWLPARDPEPLFPGVVFSDPEVATVGMSPQQIAQRYHPNLIKRIHIDLATQTDRGYTDDVQQGFIVVDAIRLTGRILGVTIVAPKASEMISFFTLAIQEGISLYRLYRIVYPYPTFSSGIQRVADTFLLDTLTNLHGEVRAYLRYRPAKPEGAIENAPVGAVMN
ncbi:MAG: NAD(P)/FAD-dependent oxidoreductase [Roseiflexaceae bacterium]|nr:NAD(P)/FAD-dependent oxidoreductase [Roseiflexaceae bacterium]